MRIASWNLNHRVGKTRFRPEAVDAAVALDADVIFFNEYFPRRHGPAFEQRLADAGWCHQIIPDEPAVTANRTIVVSRFPVTDDPLPKPAFDDQFPPNVLAVRLPEEGLRVLAVRIPWYESPYRKLTLKSWEWLESSAMTMAHDPAIIVGDLNASPRSPPPNGGDHFRRLLGQGWTLATPATGASYWSSKGTTSTLDHLLHTANVHVASASFLTRTGEFQLAGSADALSDHAALVAELHTTR